MRDAFGGTFMIKLALIFIIIYVSFMAVAINYSKAFRVKNQVINIIEQNQYSGINDSDTINKIDSYLRTVGYNYNSTTLQNHCKSSNNNNANIAFTARGACIVPKGNNNNRYYKVTTYIYIELPFFNLNMTIPISGETKIITG